MSCTDRSQTERIRRIRGQLQAVRRAECASCPEEGPHRMTDQSTWLSRRVGQATYYRQIATGGVVADSCCSPAPPVVPPINITVECCDPMDLCLVIFVDPTKTYTFTASNNMSIRLVGDGVLASCVLALGQGETSLPITGLVSYSTIRCDIPISCSVIVQAICNAPPGTMGPGLNCIVNNTTSNVTVTVGDSLSIGIAPGQSLASLTAGVSYSFSC
jgi:hypothetical protein